jgi:hypothetical protein
VKTTLETSGEDQQKTTLKTSGEDLTKWFDLLL